MSALEVKPTTEIDPQRDEVQQVNEQETRERMEAVERAVRGRDGDRCRYCGLPVGVAAPPWVFDFVDPAGPLEVGNVVVACRPCAAVKGDRTPEDADMPLLPVGLPPAAPWHEPSRLDRATDLAEAGLQVAGAVLLASMATAGTAWSVAMIVRSIW